MNLIVSLPLAFLAGVLTILSPCVLPLAPIIVASARAQDPRGPLALVAGLALTFGIAGGALASIGVEFGSSPWVRGASAAVMLVIGAALLFPRLAAALEERLAPIGSLGEFLRERLPNAGLLGQAAAGAVIAFAWAPCAGPTLGAAFLLAAAGGSLAAAILTMTIYAIGASAALLALGYGLGRLAARARWNAAGAGGRIAFGVVFAALGAAILTGADHLAEAAIIGAMPDWLTTFAASL